MNKTLIASVTVFALLLSAGTSMARPAIGHGAFAGGLSHSNLGEHVKFHNNIGNEFPVAGTVSSSRSSVKENLEAAIDRKFELGVSSGNQKCSEIPPHDHHSKYSPCY
jgi:hypothetical protein